jgi:predicted amidophosphoribosyltransferase
VCLACATPPPATVTVGLCPVCEQAKGEDGTCANSWCGRADRWFSVVWAIGPHTGPLRRAISAYKYRDERMWGAVFGRLLVAYLDEHMPWFDEYDALTAMPAYTGPGARRPWDHVGLFTRAAARLAEPRWPFEPGLVVKTAETTPLVGLGLRRRRACAEGQLRRALVVPDPGPVLGRRLLVVDDVFTEGSTLREVARALVLSGAVEVAGLVLARQPWVGEAGSRAAEAGRRLPPKVLRCRPTASS